MALPAFDRTNSVRFCQKLPNDEKSLTQSVNCIVQRTCRLKCVKPTWIDFLSIQYLSSLVVSAIADVFHSVISTESIHGRKYSYF
jgi:hypothetical protein